ncbi:hypothetical protein [Hyalangium rubrum]|uniref:Lipoprotein n=1 Tax=Hyalangium rubrum TaxID=3103134 RepID=A0ABU5H2U8_9BACT|nr:hypothetical protein [Hyalangium sp. s54d21]MDY7227219.1 hypothetical protein [Hyalangium sp. s54d21]
MRIPSLLVAFITGLTLAVTGCGGTYAPEEAPASETVLVDEQAQQSSSEENVSAQAICARKWTCDWGTYYSTASACSTACGGNTCYLDYDCNGRCVCP